MLTDTQRKDLKTALTDYKRAVADWDTDKIADAALVLDGLYQDTLDEAHQEDDADKIAFVYVMERCLDERGQADAEKWVAAALLILEAL